MAEKGNRGQFKPGHTCGRPTGSPNKTTAAVRSAITAFVEGNAEQVQKLWTRVAKKDPGRALEIYAKLAEFALPKLSRSTISGDDEKPPVRHEIIGMPGRAP